MTEIPIAWGFNQTRSTAWSNMRLLNMYPESSPQGMSKTPIALFSRPGLKSFTTVGVGPIRGIHTMDGVPFVVSGSDVFTFNSSGVATNIGTIGGTDRVDMDDNGNGAITRKKAGKRKTAKKKRIAKKARRKTTKRGGKKKRRS